MVSAPTPENGVQAWTLDSRRPRDLSLLLPVLNVESRLQTYLDLSGEALAKYPGRVELMILDRGSTDGTTGILAHEDMTDVGNRKLRRVYLEENGSEGGALRIGMARAKGRNIAVLGGNLGAPPSCLDELLETLDKGAELALIRLGPVLADSFACSGDPAHKVALQDKGPDHPLSALLKLGLRTHEIAWKSHPHTGVAAGFDSFIPFEPLAWFDRWKKITLPRVLHDTEGEIPKP